MFSISISKLNGVLFRMFFQFAQSSPTCGAGECNQPQHDDHVHAVHPAIRAGQMVCCPASQPRGNTRLSSRNSQNHLPYAHSAVVAVVVKTNASNQTECDCLSVHFEHPQIIRKFSKSECFVTAIRNTLYPGASIGIIHAITSLSKTDMDVVFLHVCNLDCRVTFLLLPARHITIVLFSDR